MVIANSELKLKMLNSNSSKTNIDFTSVHCIKIESERYKKRDKKAQTDPELF